MKWMLAVLMMVTGVWAEKETIIRAVPEDDIIVFVLPGDNIDSMRDGELKIEMNYDDQTGRLVEQYFTYTANGRKMGVNINAANTDTILAMIDKYTRWASLAIQKKVGITKELGEARMMMGSRYGGNGDWTFETQGVPFMFLSFDGDESPPFIVLKPQYRAEEVTIYPVFIRHKDVPFLRKIISGDWARGQIQIEMNKESIKDEFN